MSQRNEAQIQTNIPVLREACDACHRRKMRCPAEGVGACLNCRRTGQVCQYSPRSEMGRPRRKSPTGRRTKSGRSGSKASASLTRDSSELSSMTISDPQTSHPQETAQMSENQYSDSSGLHIITNSPLPLFTDSSSVDPSLLPSSPLMNCASWAASTTGLLTGTVENTNAGQLNTEVIYPSDQTYSTIPRNSPAFVIPLQQRSPLADDVPPQSWSVGSSRYNEAYCQLSSILYTLQVSSPDFSELHTPTLQPCQVLSLDQIFEQVSVICDIVSWLSQNIPPPSPLTGQARTYSTAANNYIDHETLQTVIKSLLATILVLYSERLKKYQSLCAHFNFGNFPTNIEPRHRQLGSYDISFSSYSSRPPFQQRTSVVPIESASGGVTPGGIVTPQHQIQILTNAATMEFHLGALRKSLKNGVSLGICDERTLEQVEGLRIEVKQFVDFCRHDI